MVEAAGGVSFPVVFFDGERENNIGMIAIYPTMTCKMLQSALASKIGISPNQFSIYFCKKPKSTMEAGWRMAITGKVNFGSIIKEKNCFFLAVLRRRTGVGRQRGNRELLEDGYYSNIGFTATTQPCKKNPPADVMLLRRNAVGMDNYLFSGFVSPMADPVEYQRWERNLQIEREMYLMNMGLANLYLGREEKEKRDGSLRCEQCLRAKMMGGSDVEFHCCVHDAVTVGFKSAAGPIAPPGKGSE